MSTNLAIKRTDFVGITKIPAQLPDPDLKTAILRAQDFDLARETGPVFYSYLFGFVTADGTLDPATPEEVKRLFNGYVYEYRGVNMTSPSLKEVLVYFATARLAETIDAHLTPHGLMDKTNEFSEHVSLSRKGKIVNVYENMGLAKWNLIKGFMDTDRSAYPQYYGDDCGCGTKRGGMRPRTINLNNSTNNSDARTDNYYRRR